jgi:hypothetical protein
MQANGMKALCYGINIAIDDICRENMGGVWVWIAEEVGKRYSRKGVAG